MTRKAKRGETRIKDVNNAVKDIAEYEKNAAVATEVMEAFSPKPREFVPRPCSACSNLRPPNTNYSRVYGHQVVVGRIIRYCRCGFCGNTYKDSSGGT
jgi:hypothetical protein